MSTFPEKWVGMARYVEVLLCLADIMPKNGYERDQEKVVESKLKAKPCCHGPVYV